MAKKKKLAFGTSEAEPLQPGPVVQHEKDEEAEADSNSDSNNGTFLDDDTEDFLPSKWTGKAKKGLKYGKAIVNNEGAMKSITTSIASISITSTSGEITKEVLAAEQSISKTDDIEPVKSNTVMVSRHAIPAALIRTPRKATDALQAQISSLKHQLEKKEKDLKASKQQTTVATSELAKCKKLIGNLRNTNAALDERKFQLEKNDQG